MHCMVRMFYFLMHWCHKCFALARKISYQTYMAKWPLSRVIWKNAIAIWYLNENELIKVIGGHIDLKQPRNYKFKYGWAWAKPTLFHLNTSVDFFSCLISWSCTYSESWQNFRFIAVLQVSVTSVLKFWYYFKGTGQ